MLHHISFGVRDLEQASTFYDALLGALGYVRVESSNIFIGYGFVAGQGDKFALKLRPDVSTAPREGFHLAFTANSTQAVDAAYAAGLRHGGRDNGAPGPRPHYGPHYYACFLIDPDGHHVEVVINR
jgi:catechol 2,3-dioxygenase-like lactoylglutathione lyase family enzyme